MSHREFCERFIASMSAGDFDALAAMLDEDFVVHEAQGLPYAGDYHGITGWRTLSHAVVSTWGSFRLKPLEFLGETADTFVVRFAISGRSRKTGKYLRVHRVGAVEIQWRAPARNYAVLLGYTHMLALADVS